MTQKRTGSRKQHDRIGVFQELQSRGHTRRPCAPPKGGCHLRQVPWEHLGRYLAGRVRDNRSFETKNRKGDIIPPLLTYWTFVNFSRPYKFITDQP